MLEQGKAYWFQANTYSGTCSVKKNMRFVKKSEPIANRGKMSEWCQGVNQGVHSFIVSNINQIIPKCYVLKDFGKV